MGEIRRQVSGVKEGCLANQSVEIEPGDHRVGMAESRERLVRPQAPKSRSGPPLLDRSPNISSLGVHARAKKSMTEVRPGNQRFPAGAIRITGYSGSGKTAVARQAERILRQKNIEVVLLIGDDLRRIFVCRWGYERAEQVELGQGYFRLANHLSSQGVVVIIAAVAMYDQVRQ